MTNPDLWNRKPWGFLLGNGESSSVINSPVVMFRGESAVGGKFTIFQWENQPDMGEFPHKMLRLLLMIFASKIRSSALKLRALGMFQLATIHCQRISQPGSRCIAKAARWKWRHRSTVPLRGHVQCIEDQWCRVLPQKYDNFGLWPMSFDRNQMWRMWSPRPTQ